MPEPASQIPSLSADHAPADQKAGRLHRHVIGTCEATLLALQQLASKEFLEETSLATGAQMSRGQAIRGRPQRDPWPKTAGTGMQA